MNRQYGFTLVELMVTLAIGAIILAFGVPSFQSMMRTNRAATQANEFTSAINLARSEAAKRGRNMVLCPSSNQTSCTGGTDWAAGWLLFIDTNNNDTLDGAEQVFRVWSQLSGNPTFTGPTNVSYRPTGDITGSSASFGYSIDEKSQAICINAVGRSHVEKDATTCP